jgi:tRNA-dihydrouridine synthase
VADAERMLAATGCAGVSIGRGALLNPWIFAQLQRWDRGAEPGPAVDYGDRLAFVERHFQLLVEQRGERFACLTFRKVANWYCRVLRPGRDIQQRLVRLESASEFAAILGWLREQGPPAHWSAEQLQESPVAVPAGPNAYW